MVLREMFGGELERLTGGWGKLQWALGEWDLWCRWDVSEGRKLRAKHCVKFRRQFVAVDWRNNIIIYLRDFGGGKSTALVWLSIVGNTVPVRVMLSVRDTAIAAQKVSPEFEQCTSSLPLVLPNTVVSQFLYTVSHSTPSLYHSLYTVSHSTPSLYNSLYTVSHSTTSL